MHRNIWQVVFATLYDTYVLCVHHVGTRGVLSPRLRKSELGATQEKFGMRRKGRPGMTRSHVLIRVPDQIKSQYNCFNLALEG